MSFFAILCGGIYFGEFTAFSAGEFAGFIIGVIMILSGVYGLAPSDMKLDVPEDNDDVQEWEDEVVTDGQDRMSGLHCVGKHKSLDLIRLEGSFVLENALETIFKFHMLNPKVLFTSPSKIYLGVSYEKDRKIERNSSVETDITAIDHVFSSSSSRPNSN